MDQPTHDPESLAAQVINACHAMGFALAGIAPAEPTARPEEFRSWLASGSHGDMDYMAEAIEERLDIRALLPGAKSVIIVADQYAVPQVAAALSGNLCDHPTHPTGRVAKYARGRDYHAVIRRRLHTLADRLRELNIAPNAHFRTFVDTAPVLEREHATRANLRTSEGSGGVGGAFVGKHTLLIHPTLGSYLLLGGIATTLDICLSHPTSDIQHPTSPCGSCTRCIDACPTRAITPNRIEATRCISYLTLEHRGLIDPQFHAPIADHLLGCDICQDVCPFNQSNPQEHSEAHIYPAYADSENRAGLPLLKVLNWTEHDRTEKLGQSAAKRASLPMLKRNALIAAANSLKASPNPDLHAAIKHIAQNEQEHPVVRDTAKQVLSTD